MPLSLRLPLRRVELDAAPVVRSMEEGDTRLGRSRLNATVRLRHLLHGSERRRKADQEFSAAQSTGSMADFELQELQEMLQEQPSVGARRWDKFRSLWQPQDLENNLKQMLRLAGCSLRILEAVKQEDNEQLMTLCADDELSLVEEEVGMLAGCLFGRPKLVKKMLKKGVLVSSADTDGRSALHLAAFSGNLDTVKCLVKYGANVNALDGRQSTTPLICAAAVSSADTVAFLVDNGADVDAGLDPSDETALHYAVRANSYTCAELLLKAGARTSGTNPRGETPLHVAADYGFDRCMGLLLKHGANVDLVSGTGSKTALHLAVEDGRVQCAKLLREFGARIDLKTSRGQTALHLAARAQSVELIELLLSWDADINARDNDLRTPLHCSIGKQCRSLDTIKVLVNNGALINEGDIAGYTPLHLAAINEFSSCVELLMDHGGDVTLRNRGGVSCLQLIKHRTPSVLTNLPDRFSRSILFYERDNIPNNKFAELKISFNPLMSQAKGECHFLKALIDIDQKHLLKHPLCESFLHMKWMKVRKFLFFNVFYYLVFCILLSAYVLGTCHGDCFNVGRGLQLGLCSGISSEGLVTLHAKCHGSDPPPIQLTCSANKTNAPTRLDLCDCAKSSFQLLAVQKPSFYTGLWYLLVVFDVTLVFKEIFQLVQDPPQYFRNPENLAEWALMFFLLLIGTPIFGDIALWQNI
ncbi:transient receptor potential channel pyrexia-like [Pollicipes pollicipes]|uniref:transient receptor potential channel pyrexia-like n=1 Tax=Pollicipes pollicipes TaxID=41117 RepID=UPI0018852119|nr:transient receptor potential channel pyrexia-like [Pollicipes pollicipes]